MEDDFTCEEELYNAIVALKANDLYEELVDDFILYDAVKQE
jgi:hypothetical protein